MPNPWLLMTMMAIVMAKLLRPRIEFPLSWYYITGSMSLPIIYLESIRGLLKWLIRQRPDTVTYRSMLRGNRWPKPRRVTFTDIHWYSQSHPWDRGITPTSASACPWSLLDAVLTIQKGEQEQEQNNNKMDLLVRHNTWNSLHNNDVIPLPSIITV